jgi:hypothetical protein
MIKLQDVMKRLQENLANSTGVSSSDLKGLQPAYLQGPQYMGVDNSELKSDEVQCYEFKFKSSASAAVNADSVLKPGKKEEDIKALAKKTLSDAEADVFNKAETNKIKFLQELIVQRNKALIEFKPSQINPLAPQQSSSTDIPTATVDNSSAPAQSSLVKSPFAAQLNFLKREFSDIQAKKLETEIKQLEEINRSYEKRVVPPSDIHLTVTAQGARLTSPSYSKESIDNMVATAKSLGWKQAGLIPDGQPGAIPPELKDYAYEKFKEAGIPVKGYQPVITKALDTDLGKSNLIPDPATSSSASAQADDAAPTADQPRTTVRP